MKSSVSTLALTLLFVTHATGRAETEPLVCQSTERQTALVELYTSEGCSSCPPAETWLSGLKESPRLWKDFVPVAFHVDYWDYLGWRDAWSDPQFAQRQRAYSQRWQSESIYTPEFVLNGREWRSGWTKRTIPAPAEGKVGVLLAKADGTNRWTVSFTPEQSGGAGYAVNVALLESGVSSDVRAGENSGRKLLHDFAVVKLASEALVMRDGAWRGEVTLPPPSPAPKGRLALALWVCRAGELQPVQAAGCWLPPAGLPKGSQK